MMQLVILLEGSWVGLIFSELKYGVKGFVLGSNSCPDVIAATLGHHSLIFVLSLSNYLWNAR